MKTWKKEASNETLLKKIRRKIENLHCKRTHPEKNADHVMNQREKRENSEGEKLSNKTVKQYSGDIV